MKFAIIYYSKTGHTREMAEVIARGLAAAGGETRFFSVEDTVDADYIDQCAGIIFGTPTYLANTCWQIDAARQNSPGECVITSGTSDCMRCKKIAKAGQVPAFFVSPVVVWGMAGLACAGA